MPFAYLEERTSTIARRCMPILAKEFDIIYLSTSEDIPAADFKEVYRFPTRFGPGDFELANGPRMSACADELYRRGKIDFACVFSSIGFMIRKVPYMHFAGGSFFTMAKRVWPMTPVLRRPRFAVTFLHLIVPEWICSVRARKVVAVSEALKQELIQHYRLDPRKTGAVRLGIETGLMDMYREEKFFGKSRLLYTGRFHVGKGIYPVLMEFCKNRDLDVEFLIAGGIGPLSGQIEALAGQDQRIKLLGWLDREQLRKYLDGTTIYVFPTLAEGCPIALAEAVASGHACVVYDIPVNRELLGSDAIFVEYNRPDLIIKGIRELLADKEKTLKLAKGAYGKIKDFTWEKCAEGLSREFRNMYRLLGKSDAVR